MDSQTSTSEVQLPPQGRFIAAGLAAASAIGLALNHFVAERHSVASLLILALAPLGLFVGLGGISVPCPPQSRRNLPVQFMLVGVPLVVGWSLLVLVFVVTPGK
jgi:hypothetical protein